MQNLTFPFVKINGRFWRISITPDLNYIMLSTLIFWCVLIYKYHVSRVYIRMSYLNDYYLTKQSYLFEWT